MKNCIFYFLMLALLFLVGSCKDSDDNKSTGATYDPNQPVTVESFMPAGGKLREKVIVKGSNFGTDKSKVKVYFVDGTAERQSTVINVDDETIYCLAPRQLPGGNHIKVVVEDKEVITDATFEYEQAQNVSTIAGSQNVRKSEDGTLAEASFEYTWGIGAVGNNTVLVFQRDNPRVRLVSVDDNKVTTIHPGFKAGKPAVTKDRQRSMLPDGKVDILYICIPKELVGLLLASDNLVRNMLAEYLVLLWINPKSGFILWMLTKNLLVSM